MARPENTARLGDSFVPFDARIRADIPGTHEVIVHEMLDLIEVYSTYNYDVILRMRTIVSMSGVDDIAPEASIIATTASLAVQTEAMFRKMHGDDGLDVAIATVVGLYVAAMAQVAEPDMMALKPVDPRSATVCNCADPDCDVRKIAEAGDNGD